MLKKFYELEEEINRYMKKALENYDLPGLAVGVSVGGNSYANALGVKDFFTKEALKSEDIFHMASVTKLLVGTSVLQLCQQGDLAIDEKLVDVLPWFEMADERYKEITIAQLLSHTAGMPDVKAYHWETPEMDEGALERFVRSEEVQKARLLWGPDENRFSYSNIGYEILGVVIAKVSGMSFEAYVKKAIFDPLHMKNSTLLTFERDMKQVCTPHTKNKDKQIIKEPYFPYNRAHGPSSTLTSNLQDLERLAKGILSVYNGEVSSPVIHQDTLARAWEVVSLVPNNGEHICLSWFKREQEVTKKDGERVIFTLYGHEGTDNGFRASFWICPKLNMHIAVVSNISNAPVKKISKELFAFMLGN